MRSLLRLVPPLLLAACGAASAATLTLSPGQTGRLGDFTLTVLRVQDSRCRPDVQCIQAGELKASVLVSRGNRLALLRLVPPGSPSGFIPLAVWIHDPPWWRGLRLKEATFDQPPRLTFTDERP